MTPWAGRPDRECGEHYTLGHRAWCYECTEYCYPQPEMGCKGCRLGWLGSMGVVT
jgi:hypothetical protein